MASFLLGWEYGGGLGHAARLLPLAQGLLAQGHRVTLMLRDLALTDGLLRDSGLERLQTPLWLHKTQGVPDPQASIAEILLATGYLRANDLAGQVQGWRSALRLTRADVFVSDYAPTGVLAARAEGLPSAVVGIGFYMPPEVAPMPPFRNWEPLPTGRIEHAERAAKASADAVLARAGKPPLTQLSELFHGEASLMCSWPELDHYGRGRLPPGRRFFGVNVLPSSGTAPQWPGVDGPKVFAYLKAGHPDHADVLRALVARGCNVLCYLPEIGAGMPPPVVSPRIAYSGLPVDLDPACEQADLVVCHAGAATLVQALLAGKPLLLLPMQAEQFLISQRVRETGAGINAAAQRRPVPFAALLAELLDKPEARLAAQAFAARYAGTSHEAQTEALVAEIAALAR
ncbi:MAG: hypothetical protein HY020_14205 [Burkholderiales bacterium]|nr:hypothetical protein [Burkholderiales bacterium]